MVGVPALAACAATSSWMYWPHFRRRNQAMKRGPMKMESTRAVIRAAMERKEI